MNHGRDHMEREQKVKSRRASPLIEDDELETSNKPGLQVGGAEVAPTKRAELRERIRHQEERMIGRRAAGVGDNPRDHRERSVSRAQLDQAARMADRAAIRTIPRPH